MTEEKPKARLEVRMSAAEKEMIEANAAKAKMTVTEYVRRCCLKKKVMDTSWVPGITNQIIRIGVNINQVAVAANKNKSVSDAQIDLLNRNLIELQNKLQGIIDCMQTPEDKTLLTVKDMARAILKKLDERDESI